MIQALLAFALLTICPAFGKDSLIEQHFRGKGRNLRPSVFEFDAFYFRNNPASARYAFEGNYIQTPSAVTISRIKLSDSSVRLTLEPADHSAKGGDLVASWSKIKPSEEDLIELLETAFVPEHGPDNFEPYVLNRRSNLIHFVGANHLPALEDRVRTSSLATGKLCPVCFPAGKKNGPGDPLEYEMARVGLFDIRRKYRLLEDKLVVDRIRRVGQAVIAKWPSPRIGFEYSFDVLDDPEMNAFALPTGHIYVLKGMLSALESDDELEALLAHEIAHVEERHALREYHAAKQRETNARVTAAVLTVGAGLAAGLNSGDARVGVETAGAVALLSGNLFSLMETVTKAGYSQALELNADYFAGEYLRKVGGPKKRESFEVLLAKSISAYPTGNHWMASNPGLERRLDAFTNTVEFDEKDAVDYVANTASGEVIAKLSIARRSIRSDGKHNALRLAGLLQIVRPIVNEGEIFRSVGTLDLSPSSGVSWSKCQSTSGSVAASEIGRVPLSFECENVPEPIPDLPATVALRELGGGLLRLSRSEPGKR